MQKLSQLSWSIIIYVLLLVNIAIIVWIAIFNSSFILSSNRELSNYSTNLGDILIQKSNIILSLAQQYNTNGSGMVDAIGCPTSVVFEYDTFDGSGALVRESSTPISTDITYTLGSIRCEGTFNSSNFYIYLNDQKNNFSVGYYSSGSVTLTGTTIWSSEWNFSDTLNTTISFDDTGTSGDGLDDNFNSDDYLWTSSWALYPNNFLDDDDIHRKIFQWTLEPNSEYENIFWNTYKTHRVIWDNLNNSFSGSVVISEVTDGIMQLFFSSQIEPNIDLKIFELDDQVYEEEWRILMQKRYEWTGLTSFGWYIQQIWVSGLGISRVKTWNELEFDFQNNNYAFFVKNNLSEALWYALSSRTGTGISITGTGIYIVPVDDSGDEIRILPNHIFISPENEFSSSHTLIVAPKP